MSGCSFLAIIAPNQPTNVKISKTDNSSVLEISWEIKESPGLGYFTVMYHMKGTYTRSRHISAAKRSVKLLVKDPETVQKISLVVEPYGASGNIGRASSVAGITVSERKSY